MQESSTGSFCPSVRNPRLHGYLSFAGSLLETAAKSLHLSCGSELTRQGISLWPCLATTRQLGGHVVPARRRADGTISSSKTHVNVRRMVSEDSSRVSAIGLSC